MDEEFLGSPWKIGEIDYALRENKNFKEPNTEEKLFLIIEHLDELIKEKGDHGLLIAGNISHGHAKTLKEHQI